MNFDLSNVEWYGHRADREVNIIFDGNPEYVVKFNDTDQTLIVGGCSFTEASSGHGYGQWGEFLARNIHYNSINHGKESSGNEMIARKIRWQVLETLKTVPAEKIMVGVQWSCPARRVLYLNENCLSYYTSKRWHKREWYLANPITRFPTDDIDGVWRDVSPSFLETQKGDFRIMNYYRTFENEQYFQLQTLEEIIHMQLFLKAHNIRYFMFPFTYIVLENADNKTSTKWLYDQIDFDYWLPINNYEEWFMNRRQSQETGTHPDQEDNIEFATKLITPFLENKNWI